MRFCLSIAFACLLLGASRFAAADDRALCLDKNADVLALPATPEVIECLLASQRPSAALLLTQRLLAVQPTDAKALALLADALAALNAEPATYDFSDWQGAASRPLWRSLLNSVQHAAWIGVEVGSDSNINSATSQDTIPIPLLNYRSLTLDPLLTRRPSSFVGINAGAAFRKPLSASLAVGARGTVAARFNSAEYSYLPHSYQAEVSVTKYLGDTQLDAELGFAQDWIAGYRFTDRLGIAVRASTSLLQTWRAELSASGSQNRYPQFNGVKTTQLKGSAGLTHGPSGLSGSVHYGEELAAGSIKDLDRRFTGFSLSGRWPLLERGTLVARFGMIRSEYLLPSPLFVTQRVDTANDIELAFTYRLSDHWFVTPRVIAEQNKSSIPVVSFKRHQGMVELRRSF